MKKFIPVTAVIALAGGIAAGSALAFPPGSPAMPSGIERVAFGPGGSGPMGGPDRAGREHAGREHAGREHGLRQHARHEQRHEMHKGGGPRAGQFGNIEQRAERMKERLQITDAQKPQWDALVGVMQKQQRAFAARQADVWQKRAAGETPKTLSAPERMAERNKAMETRLNSQREFIAAFGTLYNTMSPDQKKIADDLLSGRRHRG
jgi:hypothetical protein